MKETKETFEIPDSELSSEILQIVRVSLGTHRLKHPKYKKYKWKSPEEAVTATEAKDWIQCRMDEIKRGVIDFGRESEYTLLMAVYHVLRCCILQTEQSHVIPSSAARNLSRELADIVATPSHESIVNRSVYGTPIHYTVYVPDPDRLAFLGEEQLLEAILSLGEKHGVIIDGRRPRILPDGNVRMGFKFSKVDLENRQSEIVKKEIRQRVAAVGDWYVDFMRRTDPGLYHVNKGGNPPTPENPNGEQWDFMHCV